MDHSSQSCGLRPVTHGLSYGLKIARLLSIFTPVFHTGAALSSPFWRTNKGGWQKPSPFIGTSKGTREIKVRLRRAVAGGAHPRRISLFESMGKYKNNPNPQTWFGLFFFGIYYAI